MSSLYQENLSGNIEDIIVRVSIVNVPGQSNDLRQSKDLNSENKQFL